MSDKHEGVSYADIFQLASATAIELAGGPKIPLRFGRKDARNEEDCCPEGRLPGAAWRDCGPPVFEQPLQNSLCREVAWSTGRVA